MGTGGTVTVDTSVGGAVNTSGMQFYVDGYTIKGDSLNLLQARGQTDTQLNVGDGTSSSAGYVATINSILTGAVGVNKVGFGTSILGGVNTYTGDTTSYGPGLTLTWYGNNGWYSDNQAQLSWYQSSLNSDTLNKSMTDNNHAHGYALSTEVGKHFALSDNWSLTPQTQQVYSSVKFNDFTDPYGTAIHDNGNGSLVWRVGVAPEYKHNWQDGKGHSGIRVYGIMDIEKTFSAASSVNVSGINVSRQDQTEWGNVGMGGEVQLADGKYRLYGEVSGKTAIKGSAENNYAGSATVGIRINF